MEFIKPGTYIDFMRYRTPVVGFSLILVTVSLISLFVPGPNFGIDFAGGTELQVEFQGEVSSGEVRDAMEALGYDRPDVVAVEGSPNEYIIRVREVSSMEESRQDAVRAAIEAVAGEGQITQMKVSPGGDKIAIRSRSALTEATLRSALTSAEVEVREVTALPSSSEEFRYEAYLVGLGDTIVDQLQESFGERAPAGAKRIEWVGPKAGQQLRDAAIQSLLYAIAFIMVYVAFRFDLRFAPGGVLAMLHDVTITMGVYVLVQKEVNLTTIAALLTILGYSINDTIVVYDRIRENMGRLRERSLRDLINISTSQMLSRTIVTSGTTLISVIAFFIWGTPVIQDIAFALFIGILIGTYSSIYVAAPVTEYMDRRFFSKATA